MNQFIIIPIIFALQAIYRYLIVMKNVKIGYIRLALFFVWEIWYIEWVVKILIFTILKN
jgi:hypothetical protein